MQSKLSTQHQPDGRSDAKLIRDKCSSNEEKGSRSAADGWSPPPGFFFPLLCRGWSTCSRARTRKVMVYNQLYRPSIQLGSHFQRVNFFKMISIYMLQHYWSDGEYLPKYQKLADTSAEANHLISSQDARGPVCRSLQGHPHRLQHYAMQSPPKLAEEPAISYWVFAVKIKQAAGTCRHLPA